MPETDYRFWYFIEGTGAIHSVVISDHQYVADLKTEVHKQLGQSYGVPAPYLVLRKVCRGGSVTNGRVAVLTRSRTDVS